MVVCNSRLKNMNTICLLVLFILKNIAGGASLKIQNARQGRHFHCKMATDSGSSMLYRRFSKVLVTSVLSLVSMAGPLQVQAASPSSISNFVPTITNSFVISAADQEPGSNQLNRLKLGLSQIQYLINHWDEKTIYCNFGEFQRELLLPENKERLYKAAAETGLLDYDKSKTMNVMCRRDPEMVRAYLGFKEENPTLRRADLLMRSDEAMARIDPDRIDQYIEAVETYTQAVAAVDTLAYNARTDYASVQTSKREEIDTNSGKNDYLAQSRETILIVRDALQNIVNELGL